MINGLLDHVLSAPDSPTADLYFRNACGDFIGAGVAQLAPTVFASAEACLVMRHPRRAGRLPPCRRLIYMIDDDVEAGVTDESLPYLYRQKLRLVEQSAGRHLRRRAGVAVVGSPVLAGLFAPAMETHLLRPYWSERFAPLDHFDGLGRDAPIDIAFLGSSVHRADLEFVLPVIASLLARRPRVHFHLPVRHELPTAFDRHPRVHRIRARGWTAYRREIAGRRFHIALYPLMETPFNRARAPNKLIEHAVVGAAPLYSRSWAEARRVASGHDGLCLPNNAAIWLSAIEELIADPARMRTLAAGAQEAAGRLNRAQPQRALWSRLLGIREPVHA